MVNREISAPPPLQNAQTLRLLKACERAPRAYAPQFDMQECATGYWIRDRERPIAYIRKNWLTLDAFEFSPFASLGRKLTVHPRYDMGTYINMHAMLLQAISGNFRWPSKSCRWEWRTGDPRVLQLMVYADYLSGEVTQNTLLVGYDAATGQYLYRLHKTLRQPHPQRQEFCNLYPKDLGNGNPAGKKWQYTVWTGADGQLWKIPHTPALSCGLCWEDAARMKLLAAQGFIGWGVEEDFNLVAMIEQSSVPVVSATCDAWYDEHLSFEQPGLESLRDGRTANLEVTFRLINAPAAHLKQIIAAARSPQFCPEDIQRHSGPAFILGRVNELEEPMDPHVPQAGQLWRVRHIPPGLLEMEDAQRRFAGKLDPQAHVSWVDDCGHSGQRSIRLKGVANRVLRFGPCGHSVHVAAGATYRFEGWIKTKGARGRLWIGRCWHDWSKFYGEAESLSVEPDSDWRKVSVEIANEDYPYIVCRLVVEGDGDAWFDDLRWDEVPA